MKKIYILLFSLLLFPVAFLLYFSMVYSIAKPPIKNRATVVLPTARIPTPTPTPTMPVFKGNISRIDATWKTYSNKEGHFSIRYPSGWTVSPVKRTFDSSDHRYFEKTVTLESSEGTIAIHWTNDGYGGGCPPEMVVGLELSGNKKMSICHYVNDEGKEYFGQRANSYIQGDVHIITYAEATVNKPFEQHREIVLTSYSTLTFEKEL